MKRILTSSALSLALLIGASVPAALAKDKHSKEHNAAVKTCSNDYNAAVKEARMKKGKERTEAMAAARTSRKQCLANAPK